ncbi:hypothetical protein AYJ54_00060 [Bradyrhizobium centrolobii]|uniref:Uncharacterized protein n=1 Tax=Bradyrhizobium centrolobii TaxID=1505087 RepID=A0A176YRL4_9BRAD|nr:hypothetical protein AYJ54_00060 [Bradyrhizobium centrolobii]
MMLMVSAMLAREDHDDRFLDRLFEPTQCTECCTSVHRADLRTEAASGNGRLGRKKNASMISGRALSCRIQCTRQTIFAYFQVLCASRSCAWRDVSQSIFDILITRSTRSAYGLRSKT